MPCHAVLLNPTVQTDAAYSLMSCDEHLQSGFQMVEKVGVDIYYGGEHLYYNACLDSRSKNISR